MRLVFLLAAILAANLVAPFGRSETPTLAKPKESESTPVTEDETQCEAGDAEACSRAGTNLQYLAPVLNPKRANELNERGCKLGNKSCCAAVELTRKGIVHVYSVNVPETKYPPPGPGVEASTPSPARSSEEEECAFVTCRGKKCGCELRKEGWNQLARCPGHEWRYLIEKKEKRLLCKGISAFGGPEEFPCMPFTGEIEKFKKCTAESFK